MIPYIILTLLVILLARQVDEKNSRKAMIVCMLLLVLYAGLRGENVGTDTPGYYASYRLIINQQYFYSKDLLYEIITRGILSVIPDPAAVIFFYSMITNVLIVARLWDFRKESSFTMMMFTYLASWYIISLNVMRQFVAMAIVFWASRFLERKKPLVFILLVVVATLIHGTAFLGLFYFAQYYLGNAERKSLKKIILVLFFFVSAIVVGNYVYTSIGYKYTHYFETSTFELSLMIIYRFVCVVVILLLTNKNRKFQEFSISAQGECLPLNRQVSAIYLLGTVCTSIGMFFPYMSRVGWVFILCELPFFGQVVRSTTNRNFFRALVIFGVSYLYIMKFFAEGNNVFPYYTIFAR